MSLYTCVVTPSTRVPSQSIKAISNDAYAARGEWQRRVTPSYE